MEKEKLEQILNANQREFKELIEFHHINDLIKKAKPTWYIFRTEVNEKHEFYQSRYVCQIALPMTDIKLDIILAEHVNSEGYSAKNQLLVMEGQEVKLNLLEGRYDERGYFPVCELIHYVGAGIGRKEILEKKLRCGGRTQIAIEHYLYGV